MSNTSIIRAKRQTSNERASATFGRSRRRHSLRSRWPLLAAASGALVASLACAAAIGAPAQAQTTAASSNALTPNVIPVGSSGANCQAQGVGWSSHPLTVTMTGTICAGAKASQSGVYGLTVHTSVPGWASPFVSVTGVNGGGSWTSAYGGDEVMSTSTHIRISDPFCSLPVATGNVNLSVAMNQDGVTHKSASISPNVQDSLIGLAACIGETFE